MKDLKSLKSTEICIRATVENAEFIIPLLEKLGGVGADYLKDISGEIGKCFAILNGNTKWIVWLTEAGEKNYTEITLEQLRELAGVKEPQTERVTLKDTGWMPTFREEANEHLKQLLTFQTDLNEHINSVAQKLATLEAVKSENESLKDCLKDVKDHFSDGDENTLEALLIKIDTLLK